MENFKPMPQYPIKWQPFKIFGKLHKSSLVTTYMVKVAVSGLRQLLATENP